MPPTSKKLKGQIGLGLFVCPSIYPSRSPTHPVQPCPPPPPPKKKNKSFFKFGFFVKRNRSLVGLKVKVTLMHCYAPNFEEVEGANWFGTVSLSIHLPRPTPSNPPPPPPPPPPKKKNIYIYFLDLDSLLTKFLGW